jgi:hypothetical protein
MTLAELFQALQNAAPAGVLNPYNPAPDPNQYLIALPVAAAKFGPSGSLSQITGVTVTQTGDSVTATGSATLAVPGADAAHTTTVAVTITATLPTPTTPRFDIALAGPARGWLFGTTFPNLPLMQGFVDGLLPWVPSYLGTVEVRAPVFSASSDSGSAGPVAFSGVLPITRNGALDDYPAWIGAGPLPLSGTIAMPQTAAAFPAIDLYARITGPALNIGTFSVRDLRLELESEIGLDSTTYGVTSLSKLSVVATLVLGTTTARLSAPLLQGDAIWPLYLRFADDEARLSGGLRMITGLFDGLALDRFPLPDSLPIVDDFFISSIGVGLAPPTTAHPMGGMQFVEVTLGSTKDWQPPVPFVTINKVGTKWLLTFGDPYAYSLSSAIISGTVYGDVVIGGRHFGATPRFYGLRETSLLTDDPDPNKFTIHVDALVPQFVVTGELATDDTIPLDSALSFFFGGGGPSGPFKDVAITAFSFEAAPKEQTYRAEAAVTIDVTVPLGPISIKLQQLNFWIDVTQGAVAGGLAGVLQLQGAAPPGAEDPVFILAAEYARDTERSGWTFSGRLQDGMAVNLTALVSKFLGIQPPSWVPVILIERLAATFETGTKEYQLAGTAAARWPAPIIGLPGGISVVASADLARTQDESGAYTLTGVLSGSFTISKIELGLSTNIGAAVQTYTFTARFDRLLLTVTTGQRTSKGAQQPHQVFYARLGGVTLGDILQYLVNLAAPTVGYTLEAPWDLLNRVELSRFQLMFDPTENAVEVTCDVGVDVVVMRIDKIGVRYARPGGRPTVELILEGNFLGKSYDGDDALAWNVVDDPPPAVPGKGKSLLDVRYLGLGQRVAFADDTFNRLDTVRGFLNELAQQMGRVGKPDENPLTQNPGMKFDPDSQWLIGVDLTIMDTVALGFLFNDPKLYGLSIGLSGERAGSFAGLDFEILYKKISANVGMFRIELKLPDKFRTLEFGAVSVTLGTIVLEIYTNGNFLIDLGFPYGRDYGRSFTVQVFPFIGRGGIYFGLLDGTTSRRTPKITNGTFAPVIELGIGLSVGVGKEVSFGPLSGGAYVEIEAAFQGVLAWFNPSDAGVPADKYYWAQAVVAIHGRIYGEVDFVIVKASANIDVYAEASIALEAFRATQVALSARVEVSASVTILFVTVDFSFDASVDISFTIGSDSTTPWIVAPGSTTGGKSSSIRGFVYGAEPHPHRRSIRRRNAHILRQHLLTQATSLPHADRLGAVRRALSGTPDYQLNWNPATHVFTQAKTVPIVIVAAGTLSNLPAAWSATAPPLPATPAYRLAFVASAGNGVDSSAPRSARTRNAAPSAHARDVTELPTDVMLEALLRWSISALPPATAGIVTAAQLRLLAEQMSKPETTAAFALDTLATFLSNNITLRVSGPPPGPPPSGYGAGVMPMPPFLTWTSQQAPALGTSPSVGPLYEWGAASYFSQFQSESGPAGPQPADTPPTGYESVAAFVFRDWCLMLARTGVQSALDMITSFPLPVPLPTSLTAAAASFPVVPLSYTVRDGDTVASVAVALGVTSGELLFHNPNIAATLESAAAGYTFNVSVGVSPGDLAADNAELGLAPGINVAVGSVPYQVPASTTLKQVADRFEIGGAAALFTGTQLDQDTKLLQSGATFTTPAVSYPNTGGLSLLLGAAVFYVRTANDISVPDGNWYAQAVFQLNSASGDPLASWTGIELPVGLHLQAPSALGSYAAPITYVTIPGDTLQRIGAALSLAQNFAAGSGSSTWNATAWLAYLAAVQQANPGWTSGAIMLPALPLAGGTGVEVAPAESVAMLANRLVIFAGDTPGMVGWIATQAVIAPLAMVEVPGVSFTTASAPDAPDTLGGLALRFGMSVTDFGALPAVAGSTMLLPSGPNVTLTVSHLAALTIDGLVGTVMAGPAPGNAAGMTSRQLLSGQYLPAPEPTQVQNQVAATGPLKPLLDLTGQQVNSPAPDTTQPAAIAFAAQIAVMSGYTWIQLSTSTTSRADESLDLLRARVPRLDELNPAIAIPGRLVPGLLLHEDIVPTLTIQFTNGDLAAMYPTAGLAVVPTRGPQAMPGARQVPRTYGLDHRIPLQAPIALAFNASGSAPLVGEWTLWPFSEAFEARARAAPATPYELALRGNFEDRPQPSTLIANATWATVLSFSVRRMGDRQGVYELLGADTANRQLLLTLWQRLASSSGAAGYLLYAPAPADSSTVGLAVGRVKATSTYIVKSNLGTETHSGFQSLAEARAAGTPNPNEYFASFGELAAFCTLLWEASVVGGSGYAFAYADENGVPLPQAAFDESGVAVLRLMVIDGAQQNPMPAGRPLLATNNCALIAPGLDPTVNAIFALGADESDDVGVAAFKPGTVGFTVTLPQAASQNPTPADLLAAQFGVMSYNVAALTGSPFPATQPATPISPQKEDGTHRSLADRVRHERRVRAGVAAPAETDGTIYRRYDQALPLSRFGPASEAPVVDGLPDPTQDPYRGVGGAGATVPARVQLDPADVFGNITTAASGGTVDFTVGYTDPVIGVGSWPGTTTSYGIAASGSSVALSVTVAPQAGVLAPAPHQTVDTLVQTAKKTAERYASIYYQLAQTRVLPQVLTTLTTTSGTPTPLSVDRPELAARYAAAQYLCANAIALATAVAIDTAAAPTLGDITSAYGFGPDAVGDANVQTLIVGALAPTTLTVPVGVPFAEGDTADSIVAAAAQRGAGWPVPASGAALLSDSDNATVLLLRSQTVLGFPAATFTVPAIAPSMADLASAMFTTPALLAEDNAVGAPPTLANNFVFTFEHASITVNTTTGPATLPAVVAAFAGEGIVCTVADLATANATISGIFPAGTLLSTAHLVTGHDQTLAEAAATTFAYPLSTPLTVAILATANEAARNLYDVGAVVRLGTIPVSISAGDTRVFADLASAYGSLVGDIIAANPTAALATETTLVVPGAVHAPVSTTRVPAVCSSGDLLNTIASSFGTTALALGKSNENTPWTIAGNQQLPIQGHNVNTVAGWSFNDLYNAAKALDSSITFDQTIAAIAGAGNAVQDGALLVAPPAQPPAPAGGMTVAAAAGTYHVDALTFALANAGTAGLIAPRVQLSFTPSGGAPASITTGSHDTFNSILARFAAAQVTPSLADVLAANPTALLIAQGSVAFLPSPPSVMTASMPADAGPFAAPVFPLKTWLRVARPLGSVAPGFDSDGPVAFADAPVPAPAAPKTSGSSTTLTFDAFAAAFVAALPKLRLATGRVDGESADLWAVDFGSNGIASVTVQPKLTIGQTVAPMTYALRPLYTQLQSRPGTSVQTVLQNGTLAPSTLVDVKDADAERWAIRFLADLDLFVSGPYAGELYADTATRNAALAKALAAKKKLAGAIARGVWPVLDVGMPAAADALQNARDTMQENLAVSLSHAYASAALVQYGANVSSAWTAPHSTLLPARLVGAVPPPPPQNDRDDLTGTRDFTLTSAKTDVAVAASWVPFVMTVPNPEWTRSVHVDLDYRYDQIEFDITAVPEVTGYKASDWLSFFPPLTINPPGALHTDLGAAEIPVALRAYPPVPAFRSQDARASYETPTLAQATRWTYGLTYVHQHVAQDEVRIGIETNLVPPQASAAALDDVAPDIVQTLAAYVTAADDLSALLPGWIDPARGIAKGTLENAAISFATLADNVATAWDARWPVGTERSGSSPHERDALVPYRYRVSIGFTATGGLDTLTLTSDAGGPGPGGTWPSATYTPPGADPLGLTLDHTTATSAVYRFPRQHDVEQSPYPAGTAQCLGFAWGDIDVSAIQNARGRLAVRRNEHLLDDGTTATNGDFVLETPDITAAEIVWPLLTWYERFLIGTGTPANFGQQLTTAIGTLLGTPTGQPISLVGSYGYTLIPPESADHEGVVTYLPVKLQPSAAYDSTTASDLAAAMEAWRQLRDPNVTGGEWSVGLSLYSTLGVTPGTQGRPLLQITRLIYGLTTS